MDGITNDNEAVFAHLSAWHNKGTVLRPEDRDGVTSREIEEAAPTLFAPRKLLPIYGSLSGEALDPNGVVFPGSDLMFGEQHRMIVRTDGENTKLHGVATESYKLWQVREAVDWLDSLAAEGVIRYESAFALFGGDRVVFLTRLPSAYTLGANDTTHAYLMCVVPFTGGDSILLLPTKVRVVCANTEGMAKRQASGERAKSGARMVFNIRHSGNLDSRLLKARKHIAQFDAAFAAEAAEAEALASHRLQPSEAEAFMAEMFPSEVNGEPLKGRAETTRDIKVRVVREAWKVERDSFHQINEPGMVGSAHHMLQAVTRAADHGATITHPKTGEREHRNLERRVGEGRVRDERQFLSVVDGGLADLKARAARSLLATAGTSA
jgi:hypothetical protein